MSVATPDLTLLRRACAPCTLRQFCQQSGATRYVHETGVTGLVQPLQRGASLFRVGDPQGSVYIVRSGALKTAAVTEDGEEHILGFHLPGELVGLDCLPSGAHCVQAEALTDSRVCAVPLEQLFACSSAAPGMTRELMQVIGRTALDCQAHVDVLLRRQAGERIALFLHGLLLRYRRSQVDTVQLNLPMSREDVARHLGLALETVSRGFTRLQDEGVITVAGRAVRIVDLERLRRMALLPDSGSGPEPSLQRQA